MALDQILEDVRVYFSQRFRVVVVEPYKRNHFYIFTVPRAGAIPSEIRLHENFLALTDDIRSDLDSRNLEDFLEGGIEIWEPLKR